MDVTAVSSLSTALSTERTQNAAGILLLKKALDIQSQTALQLLEGAAQVMNNPAHLGQNIDAQA